MLLKVTGYLVHGGFHDACVDQVVALHRLPVDHKLAYGVFVS